MYYVYILMWRRMQCKSCTMCMYLCNEECKIVMWLLRNYDSLSYPPCILPDVFFLPFPRPLSPTHAHEEKYGWLARLDVYMVATIVLVVSNKPIQISINNTSSDSKVTMRVDETSMARLTNPWRMRHGIQVRKYWNIQYLRKRNACNIYGGEILKYRRKRST